MLLILVWPKLEGILWSCLIDINIQYSSIRSLGPFFHSNINSPEGWFPHECFGYLVLSCLLSTNRAEMPPVRSFLLPLTIVFSLNCVAEGGLVIKKSYHRQRLIFGSSYSSIRQLDIYGCGAEQRLVWKGCKEDYIEGSSHLHWLIANSFVIDCISKWAPRLFPCDSGGSGSVSCHRSKLCYRKQLAQNLFPKLSVLFVEPARDVTKSSSALSFWKSHAHSKEFSTSTTELLLSRRGWEISSKLQALTPY